MISRNFLSEVLTATNDVLKALLIFNFFFHESRAASERTDYVGKEPTFGANMLRLATSFDACFNDASKMVDVPFVTSYYGDIGACYVHKLTGPRYSKLVVFKQTQGILKDSKYFTTSVKKMDPALVLYWFLDKVSTCIEC